MKKGVASLKALLLERLHRKAQQTSQTIRGET